MSADNRASQSNILTSQLLKQLNGCFDVECIRVLDISDRGVDNIDLLKKCSYLEIAVLRNNTIRKLDPFSELVQLRILDISNNMVSSLECLAKLENLEELNIAGNNVSSLEVLSVLQNLKHLSNFRAVDRPRGLSNPFRDKYPSENEYRAQVLRLLPQVTLLDGLSTSAIGSEIMALQSKLSAVSGRSMESGSAKFRSNDWWPLEFAHEACNKPDSSRLRATEVDLKDLLAQAEMLDQMVRHRNDIGERTSTSAAGFIQQQSTPS